MACPAAKNFTDSAKYKCNDAASFEKTRLALAKSFDKMMVAYCTAGNPRCRVMRTQVV